METILNKIIEKRKKSISKLGFSFGVNIPEKRTRSVIKFLPSEGSIFEIKRASPSKGDIAIDLDREALAQTYIQAGASAISILTETHYFKGSLDDLIAIANFTDEVALLRKDFILYREEIEVSFLCGADAVLLIARILDEHTLINLALECVKFNIAALIEIRDEHCARKYNKVKDYLYNLDEKYLDNIVVGINSRDLATFAIDTLTPSIYKSLLGSNAKVIFESGILTSEGAAFIAQRGFYSILVGEAVARNPELSSKINASFKSNVNTANNKNAMFWENFASSILQKKFSNNNINKPFVKICGITNIDDAIVATSHGAHILGFVFCSSSPRNVNSDTVIKIKKALEEKFDKLPILVAVITDINSEQSISAINLASENTIDCIQYHGYTDDTSVIEFLNKKNIAYYNAVRLKTSDDIKNIKSLLSLGCARVLVDSFDEAALGGSGVQIDSKLTLEASSLSPLWLAGGIKPDNVCFIIKEYKPELIDLSSGVEKEAGIKDSEKIASLFENINKI